MARNGTVKDNIFTYLDKLGTPASGVICKDKRNTSKMLFDILTWDTIYREAEKALKKSWELAQKNGLVPNDDKMRDKGEGEHIIFEAGDFSVVATVSKPRENFDKEMFMTAIAKAYKVPLAALEVLAEKCKVEGKPSLKKRVLEAE